MRLIANLGAEEPGSKAARVEARARGAADLWRLLFAREDRGRPWPTDLGAEPDGAVFPWLEQPGTAVAWLVTEDAQRLAESEGCRLVGPAPSVVAHVHDKAFAVEAARAEGFEPVDLRGVATPLAPEALADVASASRHIAAARARWPEWLRAHPRLVLKPRLGTSGRGRVAFVGSGGLGSAEPGSAELESVELEPADLDRLAAAGGAILEPWLERVADYSVQLYLGPDDGPSGVLLLGTLEQWLSESGAPRGLRGSLDRRGRVTSGSALDERLREAAVAVAGRARAAGYRGPCGVDAFEFQGPRGIELRAVVEFNARFTLGIVAVGIARRVRERAVAHFGLDANERLAFELALDASRGPAPRAKDGEVLEVDLSGPESAAGLRIWREEEGPR